MSVQDTRQQLATAIEKFLPSQFFRGCRSVPAACGNLSA